MEKRARKEAIAARSANPVDRIVGEKIRIFRVAKRMSQTELGTAIGVSFQQIQKYEKGVNRVGSGRLSLLAKVLEVPIYHFFEENPKSGDTAEMNSVVTELLSGPYAVRLLQAFSAIPSVDLRRKLMHMVEGIAEEIKSQ